jgi:predicted DNA-binding transcriptional regulator YafY
MADALERVVNLLTLLLERRAPMTLQQIAGELGDAYPTNQAAMRGAFERDKLTLREIGVPIETQVLGGDQAGQTAYTIDRARYELRGLVLDDDERQALQLAVAAARSDVGQEGLWKLGASVVGPSSVLVELPSLPNLPVLRTASSAHVTVSFTYRDAPRRLDPFGLLLRQGRWYVVGHDHGHGEVRTYRVDRIDGPVDVHDDEPFDPPSGFDPAAAFPADPKELGDRDATASVWIDRELSPRLRREVGDGAVRSTDAEGAIVIEVPCSNLDAFRSWLLGLGLHAEVLAPPEVRADVVAWLEATVAGAR